jgi:hypothetical protein
LHAALDDRVFNANEFGKSRLHVCPLVSTSIFRLEDALSCRFRRWNGPRVVCVISESRMPSPPAKVYRGRAVVRATPACKSGACSAVRTIQDETTDCVTDLIATRLG